MPRYSSPEMLRDITLTLNFSLCLEEDTQVLTGKEHPYIFFANTVTCFRAMQSLFYATASV